MAAIRELIDATYVDVRLVGFGGEGNLGVEIGEAELQRLLDAAPAIAAPHVVHTAPGEPHALPIRRRFVRAVTRAPAPLAASISDAISQAVHASGLAVPVAAGMFAIFMADVWVVRTTRAQGLAARRRVEARALLREQREALERMNRQHVD